MDELNEMDREVAILKGGYLAKHMPKFWYKLQHREEKMSQKSLKEQVSEKIYKDEQRRKYGIKKLTPSKKDIYELLTRVEELLKEQK